MKLGLFIYYLVLYNVGYGQLPAFDIQKVPLAPDYSDNSSWCALPFRKDKCDFCSKYDVEVSDSNKLVDVFFIHPTTYMIGENWNASVPDKHIDKLTDNKPIKYQASVFNESCRIYAPRYRQAIINSFYDTINGPQALDTAYNDVRNSFLYYLKNHNQSRPFIIASHSQGTLHAKRLIAEFIDQKSLQDQMVMAYLIGYPVPLNMYENIPVCKDSTMTNGVVSWHSFKTDFEPKGIQSFYKECIVVNPITWSTDTTESSFEQGKGAKGIKLNSKITKRIKAKIHKSILWVNIKYPIIRKKENLHVYDYNLFWYDIKNDVKRRLRYYWLQ